MDYTVLRVLCARAKSRRYEWDLRAKISVLGLQNAHFAAALWAADDLRGVLWGPVGGLIDLHFALSYRSATPFQIQSRRG